MSEPKFKNPHRISIKQWRKEENLEDENAFMAALEEFVHDAVAPAMCDRSCDVEPDGHCEHGCPSILIAMRFV